MKRLYCFLLLLVLAAFVGAQPVTQAVVTPRDARAMALGGSFQALSSGFDAFYGNPSAFGSAKSEFTVLDASTWLYLKPTVANVGDLSKLVTGEADQAAMVDTLNRFVTENGFGGGFSAGLGYIGKGLGIGAYVVEDVVVSGPNALGAKITQAAQVNAVIGLAIPIKLGGLTLSFGGDIRPFFRVDSPAGGWAFAPILSAFMSGGDPVAPIMSEDAYSSFGLAMDFGLSLELGTLSLGLSARDIAPPYKLVQSTVGTMLSSLSGGNIQSAGGTGLEAALLPALSVGLSWKPALIPYFLEPALYFEIQDPVAVIKDKESIWKLFHAGLDLEVFSFLNLRAGVNKGWLSAGFGIDLFLLELDAAIFTEEIGRVPGDYGRSGIVLQAAIRF